MSVRRYGVLVGMAVAAGPANAHRGHDALTLVTIAPSGAVTVSHRFEAHDIEPALAAIAPDAQTSLDDPEAVRALLLYVVRRFTLVVDGTPVELLPGKPELGASEVRLPFAGVIPRGAKQLRIGSRILSDVYPGQVNQVNIRAGGVVRTLTFAGGGAQAVQLR